MGSASLITDYKGDEYQRIEYTPYGETWVEKTSNTGLEYMPYRFTGKELDEETGLYYYGARYLNPRTSKWISTDPALGEYIPSIGKATASDAGSLPGMGGVFNTVNLHLYHYAGNNPIKYTDPTGLNDKSAYEESQNNFYLLQIKINLPGKSPSENTSFDSKIETNNNGDLIVDGGHAFVSLIHVNLENMKIESNTFGLYPAEHSGIMQGKNVNGEVKNDSDSYYDNVYSFKITKSDYENALNYATNKQNNPPKYNLYKNNCVDFSICVSNKANVNIPKLQIVSSPNGLDNILRVKKFFGEE